MQIEQKIFVFYIYKPNIKKTGARRFNNIF